MTTLQHANTDNEIEACYSVMAELRTHIRRNEFVRLIRQQEAEGYRLAYLDDGEKVVAVAGYRISTNLFMGKNLYVDDLVSSENARSTGFGRSLLSQLRAIAAANGCGYFHLDSGTQREKAHKFYFREGLTITSFHFSEKIG